MTVWVVRDFENEILEVFETQEAACAYLMELLNKWEQLYPETYDKFMGRCCRELLLNQLICNKKLTLGDDETSLYVEAVPREVAKN